MILLPRSCLLATLLISACGPSERVAPSSEFVAISPGDSVRVLPIKQGTVGRAGDLSIGVRSVHSGEYDDEQAVRRSGLLASLELWVEDRPSQQERVIVHAGQRLEFAGFAIFVEELRGGGPLEGAAPGSSSESVTVRVRMP